MASTGQTLFQAAYEISPIILQDGLAKYVGGYLPITAITEIIDLPGLSSKQFFAHYKPLPGSTLAEWQPAEYPFANLRTAANAVIQQPLKVSLLMVSPAQTGGGYIFKQAIFTALKLAIENHILQGGTFSVITPSFTYTNCLLTSLRDISSPSDKQVQFMFQWDFVQPLITNSGALQVVEGQLMNNISNGAPTVGNSWSLTPASTPSYSQAGGWGLK
jgi:hypothetical protein